MYGAYIIRTISSILISIIHIYIPRLYESTSKSGATAFRWTFCAMWRAIAIALVAVAAKDEEKIDGPVIGIDLGTTYSGPEHESHVIYTYDICI